MLPHLLFANILRCEHRRLLDACITIAHALGRGDATQFRRLVHAVSRLAGRHVRSEEEVLFPAMQTELEQQNLEQVLRGHDALIESLQKLSDISRSDLNPEAHQEGIRALALMARAVADCDSLTSQLGKINEEAVSTAMAAHSRSHEEDLDLLTWADCMRRRPVVPAGSDAEKRT